MRAANSEDDEQAKCPLDRKAIDMTKVQPLKEINPLGWKMIGRIEVKCPRYESLGCDWIGEYSDAYDHVHHKCPYSLDLCQWCHSSFQRRHLDQHENDDCSERPIVCSYCEESISFEDMDDHIQLHCSKVSVQCTGDKESEVVLDGAVMPSVVMSSPSTGCGEIMVRSSYQLHLRDECPATLIPCSYARHGCNIGLIKRGSMSNHLNSNMSQHLELVTAALAKTNNKLDSVVSALLDWVKESTPSRKQALLNISKQRPTNPSHKFEFDPPICFSFIEPWHLEFILYMHEEAANRKLRKLPPPPLSPFHSQTSPTIHARKEFLSSLQGGAKLDARDKEGRWLKAEVVQRKADQPPASVHPWLKVHFTGFHTRWDEWIHLEHSVDRIAPLHYFTSHSYRPRSSSPFTHQHASVLVYHWSATASERSWRRGTVVEVEATGEQAKVSYHIDSTPFMRWYHKQANEIILLE